MRKALLLVTLFLAALTRSNGLMAQEAAAGSVTISTINGQSVASSPVLLSSLPTSNLSGKVFGLTERTAPDYLVQAAIHRLYDNKWWIMGSSRLVSVRGKAGQTMWRWAVPGVHFPMPDYGKGYELSAVLVNSKRGVLPNGLVDYETIYRFMAAITSPVRGRIAAQPAANAEVKGDSAIRISAFTDVHGERLPPSSSTPLELGDIAATDGTVDIGKDEYLYVTVQPDKADEKWVMPRKGSLSGRHWTETLYLGRSGLNTGKRFRIQAIVTRKKLSFKRYSLLQWANEVEPAIRARSLEALARRVSRHSDLLITRIDKTTVNGAPIGVARECQVFGSVEDPEAGNALKAGETVWILARPVHGQVWTVQAAALSADEGFTWRAPSVMFSAEGQYELLAVSSREVNLERGRTLSDDEWYTLVSAHKLQRLSGLVTVTVKFKETDQSSTP